MEQPPARKRALSSPPRLVSAPLPSSPSPPLRRTRCPRLCCRPPSVSPCALPWARLSQLWAHWAAMARSRPRAGFALPRLVLLLSAAAIAACGATTVSQCPAAAPAALSAACKGGDQDVYCGADLTTSYRKREERRGESEESARDRHQLSFLRSLVSRVLSALAEGHWWKRRAAGGGGGAVVTSASGQRRG